MSDLVGRVKLALQVADTRALEANPASWSSVNYGALARAAIEAMREPTEDGLDAFARAFGWQPRSDAGRFNARHAWQAMIDAALSE